MRFDLHFHTVYSDGTASPQVMIKMIQNRGLDGFSVTDHDTVGDVDLYQKLARKYDLLYVCGIEITTEKGHLLAYCPPDAADILEKLNLFQPLEFYVKQAENSPVILAPAHPFDYFRHGMGSVLFDHPWSALETFNGSTVFPFSNRKAEKAAQILHLPGIGGSDAHTKYYVGLTYTYTKKVSSAEEFLHEIKKGRTSTGGQHLNIFQFSRRILKSKILK
ncbi:MAG: PHP domain-containing protein [Theionarchaea archaeon]|nr:PHP domain-containing protein [Theionarchaea archaeon]